MVLPTYFSWCIYVYLHRLNATRLSSGVYRRGLVVHKTSSYLWTYFFNPFLLYLYSVEIAFFFHSDHFIDGRTPWTSDQPVAKPIPKHRTTQTQNKHIHIPNIQCLVWDSNPRSRLPSARRDCMSYNARLPWPATYELLAFNSWEPQLERLYLPYAN
jgi:hypothetical protein